MNKVNKKILGLMSGTSMDGLDMSLVDVSLNTDYSLEYRIVESNYEQFDSTTVELINKTI